MNADASRPIDVAPVEYRRRLDLFQAGARRAAVQGRRLSLARLAVFFLACVLGAGAASGWFSWHVLWAAGVVFVGLVVFHQRADRVRWEDEERVRHYEKGLARLEDRWAGQGSDGAAFRPEGHVFADDLDLFGRASLFELLDTARTRAGEETLAGWLLSPAAPDEVRARQQAVAELRPRVDLRERLAVVGGEVSSALDRAAATDWGEVPCRLRWRAVPWVVRVLGLISTTLVAGWTFGGWPALPMLVTLALQFLVTLPFQKRVAEVLREAERPSQDLALLGRLARIVEGEDFEAAWLRDLEARLEGRGARPSRRIARLTRLMDFVDARRNQIFLPVSWLLCLGTQLAFALETWRVENGRDLARWVRVLGAFEAAGAFAGYAYEHPSDPFPEILDTGAVFEGRGLGHPLLSDANSVRNDVSLAAPPSGDAPQALLVSGSNMSGKSTLLRTVGVNALLAMAGAPVRADSLRISPLAVGASIRIFDSLQTGESRFYAEIGRMRRVVDLAEGERPCLFLLDEVLHGTNSHDRRIGAEAVIRSLLDANAIGIVTTHDLALADVAERDERVRNVHFEDTIEDGRIRFDYRLHPGVVTHSNALELMRAVGLDV